MPPETNLLRIAYGFYGTIPSASHAQLALVGYGGNGRWNQLAIGCWGEIFCLDMDMSLVDVAVTDVRALTAFQNGIYIARIYRDAIRTLSLKLIKSE